MTDTINNLKITLAVKKGRDKGKEFIVNKDKIIIGRKKGDIILFDTKISSSHAKISVVGKDVRISDLNSTNGTFVNHKKITKEVSLKNLDEIEVGLTTFSITIVEDIIGLKKKKGLRDEKTRVAKDSDVSIEQMIAEELADFSRSDYIDDDVDAPSFRKSVSIPRAEICFRIVSGPDKGKLISLAEGKLVFGRGEVDVEINDIDVSRRHAEVEVLPNGDIKITDLGSTNGTLVNRKRITDSVVRKGDLVQIGGTLLRLVLKKGN